MNLKPSYDLIRCPVCARPWNAWSEERLDPKTGETVTVSEPDHPDDTTCAQYRPAVVPEWVKTGAAQLDLEVDGKHRKPFDMGGSGGSAPLTDDAAKARREVLGGPTAEFRANGTPVVPRSEAPTTSAVGSSSNATDASTGHPRSSNGTPATQPPAETRPPSAGRPTDPENGD